MRLDASYSHSEMKTYEVYYEDGNRKLFDAPNIIELVKYLASKDREYTLTIYAIEEV